jgi:hypothetical protein
MKFVVEIPDKVMDKLLRKVSTDYGPDLNYADIVKFLIVEHPASVDEGVLYTDVEVEEQ